MDTARDALVPFLLVRTIDRALATPCYSSDLALTRCHSATQPKWGSALGLRASRKLRTASRGGATMNLPG